MNGFRLNAVQRETVTQTLRHKIHICFSGTEAIVFGNKDGGRGGGGRLLNVIYILKAVPWLTIMSKNGAHKHSARACYLLLRWHAIVCGHVNCSMFQSPPGIRDHNKPSVPTLKSLF